MPQNSANQTEDSGDSVKDAFKAALERKKKKSHPNEEHLDAHGAGPSGNDKVQRQFRRKSG